MKAESLLLSDVITHTSHSSVILLGPRVFLYACVCAVCAVFEWETEKEDMYMRARAKV